jgi:hypothetical protein
VHARTEFLLEVPEVGQVFRSYGLHGLHLDADHAPVFVPGYRIDLATVAVVIAVEGRCCL